MGYPVPHNHSKRNRLLLGASLVLLLYLCLPVGEVVAGRQPMPSGLPPGNWDHVIITHKALVPAFSSLAAYRQGQGLGCRVVTLQEVAQLSWHADLMEAIRWFIARASEDWGTRFVLLGGDAEFIPVPLGYFESPHFSWDIPLDLYYAAPHGDWDLDGDGILGELGDDDPDLTPVVALGRAPVADIQEARSFVNKVVFFETGNSTEDHDVLLTAEVGSPYPWQPGMAIQFDLAWLTEEQAEILATWDCVGDIQRLYQNWDGFPYGEPLCRDCYLNALVSGRHRFGSMMIHGISDTWSLGPDFLYPEHLEILDGMDHSLFMVAGVGEATDCRGEGVLEALLALPEGGCVGALGPSAIFYLAPAQQFFEEFWQGTVDGTWDRVGDAYRQVLVENIQFYEPGSVPLSTLMSLSIWGDPALLFLPGTRDGTRAGLRGEPDLLADASPNPFNPATEISFVLPGKTGAKVSTMVEVFDLAGRRLNRILDDDLAPGAHSVWWRGRDAGGRSVGSGLFFARIKAGSLQTVVKLVLVE